MLRIVLCCLFVAFAQAQLTGSIQDKLDDTIDTLHGWRVEDHVGRDDHILLFINDNTAGRYCYVVEVARRWEADLLNQTLVELIAEEIYAIIMDPNHREADLVPNDLLEDYRDFDAARECQGHETHRIRYTPSYASAGKRSAPVQNVRKIV